MHDPCTMWYTYILNMWFTCTVQTYNHMQTHTHTDTHTHMRTHTHTHTLTVSSAATEYHSAVRQSPLNYPISYVSALHNVHQIECMIFCFTYRSSTIRMIISGKTTPTTTPMMMGVEFELEEVAVCVCVCVCTYICIKVSVHVGPWVHGPEAKIDTFVHENKCRKRTATLKLDLTKNT